MMMMLVRVAACAMLSLAIAAPATLARQVPVDIRLAHGSEAEQATREQVLHLIRTYDVEPWLFTRSILIDEEEIPHSHPVLTLHTRHLGDDMHQLATLIHEQFHWFVDARQAQTDSAVAAFEAKWPDVPVGGSTGARDEYSTRMHLIVCDLELQGMTRLVGRERAVATLDSTTHYTWIYERVLTDPFVRETTRRFGFIAP